MQIRLHAQAGREAEADQLEPGVGAALPTEWVDHVGGLELADLETELAGAAGLVQGVVRLHSVGPVGRKNRFQAGVPAQSGQPLGPRYLNMSWIIEAERGVYRGPEPARLQVHHDSLALLSGK